MPSPPWKEGTMIIDAMTATDRIEYLENLLKVSQTTLESVAEQRDLWKAEAERWREQAGENFQVTAWKQLIEQERNRMRGL
jgi:hypothetical protein